MPSGNEAGLGGIMDSRWIAGGVPEAVVDQKKGAGYTVTKIFDK